MVVGRMQRLFGAIDSVNHDRNQNRQAQVAAIGRVGLELCVDVLGHDPPEASESKGTGWGDASWDDRWRTAK